MYSTQALQHLLSFTSGAERATRLVARGTFLLFVLFIASTTPGVGQFLVTAVGAVYEEHSHHRDPLVSAGSARAEPRGGRMETGQKVALARRLGSALNPPILAIEGHRLSHELRAPLLQ